MVFAMLHNVFAVRVIAILCVCVCVMFPVALGDCDVFVFRLVVPSKLDVCSRSLFFLQLLVIFVCSIESLRANCTTSRHRLFLT